MANNFVFNDSLPVAPLKLAALESCRDFASRLYRRFLSAGLPLPALWHWRGKRRDQ